jgi:hypothetical protein
MVAAVVSALSSPTGAGYYKLALSLANLVQLPISPSPDDLPGTGARSSRQPLVELSLRIAPGLTHGLAPSAAGLVLLLFGPLLIRYIYTPEFLPAYPAVLILLVGLLVANTYWNRIALLALGHQIIRKSKPCAAD